MPDGGAMMHEPEIVDLQLPPRPEVVSVARLVVGAVVAAQPSFDDERSADLRLAVSEACTNAVQAQLSRRPGSTPDAPIAVVVSIDDERIGVTVTDHGGGFDPADIEPHPEVTDPARLEFEGGLGIPLLRMLADDLAFVPVVGGTRVEMAFRPRSSPDRPIV